MHNAQKVELPEAKLCRIAGAKLREDGWRVVSEVPFFEWSIDLGGMKGGDVLAVEAKTSFTKRLQSQIEGDAWHADFAIAVVGTSPRTPALDRAKSLGIGVWQVNTAGEVLVLVEARRQPDRKTDFVRTRLLQRITEMPESVAGGLPCLEGQGPAAATDAAILEYRASNPKATWAEVYENVPNHYSNSRSLQGSMIKLRNRQAAKARRRLSQSKPLESMP